MNTKEWGASQSPKISARRVRQLCEDGRVAGAVVYGEGLRAIWVIPPGAARLPPSLRVKSPNRVKHNRASYKPKPVSKFFTAGAAYYRGEKGSKALKAGDPGYEDWYRGYVHAVEAEAFKSS